MEKEIWKDIKNYEGYYQVSNFGNVRSVDRVIINSDGVKRLLKCRILKPNQNRNGYLQASLFKNNEGKKVLIHRLVAEAFIHNPNNLPEVNHKDEDKTNNCISNIEFCSHLYNMRFGTRSKRSAEKRLNSPKLSKPVLQIDKNTGQVISEYQSLREAGRKLNIGNGSISRCCNGKCKTYKGFKWQYKE